TRILRPIMGQTQRVHHSGFIPVELRKLGRTLTRRACDVLAYFDRPRTSNGPTEAVNGRLEHLRGLALGFRNLTNYIARALLEAGGFRPHLHPEL
uniref:transposase n=1 Tax=Kocuria palustris TaxID=71999 RepID=UPI0021B21A1B